MHFIYVMRQEDKDKMVELGYELIKEDLRNGVWVFASDNKLLFGADSDPLSEAGIPHVRSDMMTF